MSNQSDDLYGAYGLRLTLGPTTAPYGFTSLAGQNSILMKMVTGGTFDIGTGSTSSGATLAGTGYMMTTNEVLTLDNRGTIYGIVSGATVILCILRGKSHGFENT